MNATGSMISFLGAQPCARDAHMKINYGKASETSEEPQFVSLPIRPGSVRKTFVIRPRFPFSAKLQG